jgi:hypothetical protein
MAGRSGLGVEGSLLSLALAWLVVAGPASAGEYRAPRTAYGAPSLDGTWSNASLTQLDRPDDFKTLVVPEAEAAAYEKAHRGKPPTIPDDTVGGAESEWWETDVGLARIRGQARTSWIVAPADGQLPFTAAAKAANKARSTRRKTDFDNPESRGLGERCLSTEASGPPMLNGGYNDNYLIVQTPDQIAIMTEYMHDLRIVRLGNVRHPPKEVRVWMGDSIGRWDGDALVIETTNFTAAEVRAPDGDATADMRVVERITRVSPTELHYAFMVQDPKSFVQSWRGEVSFRATGARIFEFACHEGNYSLTHELAGARQQEEAAAAASP